MNVIEEIAAERQRQITEEGWTPEHDDKHVGGLMAAAAGCYALFADAYPNAGQPPPEWPWDKKSWKPKAWRRDLIRSGALIVAEVERIDRAVARREAADTSR